MASHLRVASAADAAPDPKWTADVDELAATLKAEGVGFFCVMECENGRAVFLSGQIDPDGIAGYCARVLASVADNES